ncbi:restriction endonuclease [Streptosporangium subroseum]|uniref:restriction endonuclease n=1 Tax=Streptosporangium subroseum TaxID=106412 RepID=UPI00309173B9|nr:restriction endonuclease [Streptosporangium subroseum]
MLWLLGAVIVIILIPYALDALTSVWPLVLAIAVVLIALTACVVLVLRRTGRKYRREALERAAVSRLTPGQFEQLVAELLRNEGFRGVRVIGGARDGGIDVLGTAPGGIPYAVQCKLYTRPVGPGQVRDFIGALRAAYREHRGVLVTSSVLSKQAHQAASEDGMIVVDRDRLADWMMGAYSVHAGGGASPAWLVWLRRGRAGGKRPDPLPVVREGGSGLRAVGKDGPGSRAVGEGCPGPRVAREGCPGPRVAREGCPGPRVAREDGSGLREDGPGLRKDGPGLREDGPGLREDGPDLSGVIVD